MSNIQIRRAELKELSAAVKPLVAEGKFQNINQAIKAEYAKQGHTELRTIYEWNRLGARIRSGEKALVLWGKETTVKKENETISFFPVHYVFSEIQTQNFQPIK